jgi:hypothetical protein
MLIPRILGAAGVVVYLLAMCLPAIGTKGYDRTYLLPGWEVTYVCGLFSFAPSMYLGERAPFIVGTVANLLFLDCLILSLVGRFWRRPWPQDVVICLDFRSVFGFGRGIYFYRRQGPGWSSVRRISLDFESDVSLRREPY